MTTSAASSNTQVNARVLDHSYSQARRRQQALGRGAAYVLLAIAGIFFAFPLYWTVSSSLQTWQELRSFTPHLLPTVPQWDNYAAVFRAVPFHIWLLNSFIIIAITIPGTIITCTTTAYSFSRFNFVGKNVWFVLMLGTMMIPSTVTLIRVIVDSPSRVIVTCS